MAFYPDELSPIDRIRSLGQAPDDLGSLKNRRQWKSLVLGKKDMGINNFATITEEKEEEISSDGSQGAASNKGCAGGPAVNAGVVPNKKITFAKPRKYITSRVSDRKEEASMRAAGNTVPFAALSSPVKDTSSEKTDLSSLSGSPKPSQAPKVKKSKEMLMPAQDFIQNFALNDTPIETQWNEAVLDGPSLTGWTRQSQEKPNSSRHDAQGKNKQEEKKKSSGISKTISPVDQSKKDAKPAKKKNSPTVKKSPKVKEEPPVANKPEKTITNKVKQKTDKGKSLNMKEVVNVYKNLAYGSKEEIKSFVENLSFVKDESKAENDKNLLSMMNLKALENKIKSFAKKGKGMEASTSGEKKSKMEKPMKKCRKAHIERLARHKVVKVPAVLNNNYLKPSGESSERTSERKSSKDKEPWKYVGMESALDKTYFVYPAYPPSVNLKKAAKAKKPGAKSAKKSAAEADPKVKGAVVLKCAGRPRATRSAPGKSLGRPSATTVCTVEFRPAGGRRAEAPAPGAEESLLVYLHGTKAIHVKSPYADRQFSRVRFFRKEDRGAPLIRGLGVRSGAGDGGGAAAGVSVRNISLPGSVRSLDLLDFDEDIENITEFLRSQDTPERRRAEEWSGHKKSERDWWPREPDAAARHQRRLRRAAHDHPHHHQHGTTLCPDSIVNEISKNIQHLQYLPDTEDNREMIAHFFDELDQRIEASRKGTLALQKFPSGPEPFRPIPILGY